MGDQQLPVETWDHIVVRVSDIERSLDFYKNHLGFEPEIDVEFGGESLETILETGEGTPMPGARARLVLGRVGGQLVELIEYKVPPGIRGPKPGIAAFTLRVSDADQAHATATESGIRCDSAPVEIEGSKQFFIRDPDGTRIELTQPPKPRG
jgi:catechol 2,3-dioxygenase-like lactoylglutathione lyase family enzyme